MERNDLRKISYDDLRLLYKGFLNDQDITNLTKNTVYSDTFYLWRNGSKDLFWDTVTSVDFETVAKNILFKVLTKNSSGDVNTNINSYLSHLRRFRLFLYSEEIIEFKHFKTVNCVKQSKKKLSIDIPKPSVSQVELYLMKWKNLENYRLQEDALNRLFFDLCPLNVEITDILLKASTLNNFYSTNIFSIYPVAKHICDLNIDKRLEFGDDTLVRDIQYVTISNTPKNFYSFATKYCSHHNPFKYPIYDSFVDEVLRYFRNRDNFADFKDTDLKDYIKFKRVLVDFQTFYELEKFNLKQIDQYIWQLGKEYFPKNYGKK